MLLMTCLALAPAPFSGTRAWAGEAAEPQAGASGTQEQAEDVPAEDGEIAEMPSIGGTGAEEEADPGYPKSASPGVYFYDYADCVSEGFEQEFNEKVGRAGGHLTILVIDGFDEDQYKYEYYYNEKNGINESTLLVFNVTEELAEGECWRYLGTRGTKEENVAGNKLSAWIYDNYLTGRIPPSRIEPECRAVLDEHLYLTGKYPYPGEGLLEERDIKDPFIWHYFIRDVAEGIKGFVQAHAEALGVFCALIFLISATFLIILDTLGEGRHKVFLELIKAISMAGLMTDAFLIAWSSRWALPEGGLPAVGTSTKAAFAASLLYTGYLFLLTAVYSLTALMVYEYDAEGVIRLLFSKLNRYTAEGMLGFILYLAGIILYNGTVMGSGLVVSLIWAGIDLKKKVGAAGLSWKERQAGNVYGLVPLHAKEDLSFGCMERTRTTFFRNIRTRASLDARYRQLAKIYHPDGQASKDEAENETFERIKKEYDRLKEELPPDSGAA